MNYAGIGAAKWEDKTVAGWSNQASVEPTEETHRSGNGAYPTEPLNVSDLCASPHKAVGD
jgi:hypothetical protein